MLFVQTCVVTERELLWSTKNVNVNVKDASAQLSEGAGDEWKLTNHLHKFRDGPTSRCASGGHCQLSKG